MSLLALQEEMQKFPQIECEMDHIFAPGVYMRKRTACAGTLIVGKRHRHSTMTILLKGKLSVYNEEDESILNIDAPHVWVTKPYSKKLTFSHTETILATVHPTEETDVDKLEDELIIPEDTYLDMLAKEAIEWHS